MTTTTVATTTPEDTTPEAAETQAHTEEFVYLDPGTIIIGSNVRTDLPDAKEFRRSIKERGVLEAVTVYRNDEGQYVCLRGQRRTVEAAAVGTPTGLIPARVIPEPDEADRIVDQMVENIHRAEMRETHIVGGVEELALLGVSAAQIARRMTIPRPTVNAAMAVTKGEQSRARMEAGDLTLLDAAIFAEFEHDESATQRLERARTTRLGDSVEHVAQKLRDEATEQEAYDSEVERLRGEGLPVLSAQEADEPRGLLADMRTPEGEAVPVEEWPNLSGVAVILTEDWEYPEPEHNETASTDEDATYEGEAVKVYRPVWVVTDAEACGLIHRSRVGRTDGNGNAHDDESNTAADDAEAEARRQERRLVIANNKEWTSAETVRREWMTAFLTRKAAPKGAETLICEAVVTGQHTLSKAMDHRHPRLFRLLGVNVSTGYYGAGYEECHKIATKATNPKGAIMTTLAAVVAAWEDSTGKHTWRNPTAWDARMLAALIEWGYKPSDVERLLIGEEPSDDSATDDEAEAVENDASTDAA